MTWTWSWQVLKYSFIQLCYVHLFYRWYYGNINRQKAEKLLLSSQNKTGSFLVRISESHSDEYTISGSFPCFFSLSLTRSFIWMPGDLQYFPPEFPCLSLIHHLLSHLLSFSSPVCLICISTPSILSFSALDILSHLILHPFRSLALSTPQLVTPYWSSMCNWLSVFLSPQKSSGHFF